MAADGTLAALSAVGILAVAGITSRRGSAASLSTRTFPRGTVFFHGTANPARFEEDGLSVMTTPSWFTRDVRVARMIAVDDADEPNRPPRVLVLRAVAPIGPLAVLRTDADAAAFVADALDQPVGRLRKGVVYGPYELAALAHLGSYAGWVVPYNYASSSSLFSYGEEIVCRPPSASCDDILLRSLDGLVLERVESVPEAYLRERGRL